MTKDPVAAATVAEAIRRGLGECSPAERKVARALLAAYPAAGLETVAKVAERAGVSAPTVIRFVNRLGYRGFPEFQQALRDELDQRDASPLALYATTGFASRGDSPADELLASSARSHAAALDATFSALPPADLQRAVDLLADPKRRVLLTGGRFSGLHARYLGLHLLQVRDDVSLLAEGQVERTAELARAGRRDVLTVFDFRRYEPELLALATLVTERGGKVVLFTDSWLSPISAVADVVLPSHVGTAATPYDTLVPVLAVAETVVTGVLQALGDSAETHLRRSEETSRALYPGSGA
ncbi:MurR/RpiR family transcriptional regulator [Streptomyces indicus]|uniref:DNA-binding transcriptional regulator, MurR/RpiR family, contains HTH and SIS domains n=1 Tax=Streptomyces indicus TaxID=417292 RepID=A0A1G8UXQ1_9ACTN|nr:MurR/RpiR family transcriptional regulator [Streptomyces indicus]SDJ58583.1 DNA-binding transcriptional regulator, MurR/RpiR family, contains HTH and SIS domains [Streptomyces indicus]